MKTITYSVLFFTALVLSNCKTTTEPTPEPVNPVLAMIGSYEGDFGVQCKNATSQGPKDISKRTFSITRIGSSDSITITSTNNFLVKAKLTTGSNFVLKQADLFGEIHTGNGAVTDNKLTFSFNADATVAYGYSCVKEFSGTKKAQ